MELGTKRFTLRDYAPSDRSAFLAYQADPRYRALYDIAEGDDAHANRLFTLFLDWQAETPRRKFQLGIFERSTGRPCGCAGVRIRIDDPSVGVLGIELTPDDWGRYRAAIEVGEALAEFAFQELGLARIVSDTSSGNTRVAKIAKAFGAELVARRDGLGWMTARGWHEVDWAITHERWEAVRAQQAGRA